MDANILVDKLNSMESIDDIADFFRSQGVRGYQQDEHACVITNWISRETGKSVMTEDCIRIFGDDYDYDNAERYETSPTVKEFIDAFDRGVFEDLTIDVEYEEW